MSIAQLASVEGNKKDKNGQPVVCVYVINPPIYAIYRTRLRVMIEFADAAQVAAEQRTRLAPLAPLRGQISGLIDGWHDNARKDLKARADHLDRRVADALTIALEGDVPSAAVLLTEIRDEIIDDRKSKARVLYLLAAVITSTMLALAVLASYASGFGPHCVVTASHHPARALVLCPSDPAAGLLNGAGGGILGAFFSIAIGLRSRSILTDFHWVDNASDAVLRVVVGVISAILITCLIGAHMVAGLAFGPMNATAAAAAGDPLMVSFVFGFLAGFSERLIPDLLAKTTVIASTPGAPPSGDAAATIAVVNKISGTQPLIANAAAMKTGNAAPAAAPADGAADAEADADSCLCDAPPVTGETVTADVDLPVAVGGVSADTPAPAL
ncbi:MAG: hypothetical protein JOY99_14725 [Sphingomonadaceae bacterium]|nr:hypothetical protein [Sphingomonadaceae bacterium]